MRWSLHLISFSTRLEAIVKRLHFPVDAHVCSGATNHLRVPTSPPLRQYGGDSRRTQQMAVRSAARRWVGADPLQCEGREKRFLPSLVYVRPLRSRPPVFVAL